MRVRCGRFRRRFDVDGPDGNDGTLRTPKNGESQEREDAQKGYSRKPKSGCSRLRFHFLISAGILLFEVFDETGLDLAFGFFDPPPVKLVPNSFQRTVFLAAFGTEKDVTLDPPGDPPTGFPADKGGKTVFDPPA